MTVEVDQSIGEIVIVPSDEQQVIDVTIPEREVVTIEVPGTQGSPGKGVPAGGVSGQFLVKETDDDYDAVWVDMEDPSGAVRFDEVQNLDEEEKQQARDNIGLGSISVRDVGDFATSQQGELADTSLQPGSKIPVTDITTGVGAPIVVGRLGSSGPIGTIALEYTAIQNTVPLRGQGGIVAVGEPSGPTHAVPLSYFDERVSKIGPEDLSTNELTNNTVWTFSSGGFFQMPWSSGIVGNSLVRRNAFGRVEAAPAASDTQVTTLGQVNSALDGLPLLKTRLDGSTLYITSDGSDP